MKMIVGDSAFNVATKSKVVEKLYNVKETYDVLEI